MQMCLLYKIDLKGKKEVVEGVQEGDKAKLWKEKISERRRHKKHGK
jgi:hypothetical protein